MFFAWHEHVKAAGEFVLYGRNPPGNPGQEFFFVIFVL
jgi:hypothetical protein